MRADVPSILYAFCVLKALQAAYPPFPLFKPPPLFFFFNPLATWLCFVSAIIEFGLPNKGSRDDGI